MVIVSAKVNTTNHKFKIEEFPARCFIYIFSCPEREAKYLCEWDTELPTRAVIDIIGCDYEQL